MNKKLHKAILGTLGTAALAGLSSQAMATSITADLTSSIGNASGFTTTPLPRYVWDGGNIGFGPSGAGDCTSNDCGNLPPGAGGARVGGAEAMSGSVQSDRNYGWNHNAKWFTFQITSAGGYTISADRAGTATGDQPALSVWSSGAHAWDAAGLSHHFNQVAAPTPTNGNSYMLAGTNNINGFVGYANSGPGYVNADGNTVAGALSFGTSTKGALQNPTLAYNGITNRYTSVVSKGSFIDGHAGMIAAPYAGVGSSVNTSDPTLSNAAGGGHVDLALWLEPGWYAMTAGGSCADFTCTPTSVPTGSYNLKILANAGVTAPSAVPVPAAVWLFGSALAGMGIIGRRKQQAA
ncbi:MAG: hypothetical protein H6R26_2673 [Proteobacteria bacterium]|nr:hypothetical protein [Pseudomonadota bacterium]